LNLVVFDIDGTLTDTKKSDLDWYLRALKDECDVDATESTVVEDDLVTDSGFAQALFRKARGANLPGPDLERLKTRFMSYLEEAIGSDPGLIREIGGAARLLELLKFNPLWKAAIATGCWERSAVYKLQHSGLYHAGLPMATCDDASRRSLIVTLAIGRALLAYRVTAFDRVVLVGDRPWDVRVAAMLNFPFIGINSDGELASAGASTVVPDYREADAFITLLESARVPGDG
jgi:phosphoglycolate phosphatase-like HAD superfamily hydrolase